MRVVVKDPVNLRVGAPRVNAPNPRFLLAGSEIEVDGLLYKGDAFEGIDTWVRDLGGTFYWSGALLLDALKQAPLPWWITDFGIDEIWKKTKGEGVTVFLLDSGVNVNATADLSAAKIKTMSAIGDDGIDVVGHGTLMASIIAGRASAQGVPPEIHGIAPAADVVSIKITKPDGNNPAAITADMVLAGLNEVERLAQPGKHYVVNCSLSLGNTLAPAITAKIDALNQKHSIIFCCAVGNDFLRVPPSAPTFPASIPGVVSIAALEKNSDNSYRRQSGSNYWAGISLTAPGIYPTKTLDQSFSHPVVNAGSSHATAFASGLCALFQARAIADNAALNSTGMVAELQKCTISALRLPSHILDHAMLTALFV